MNTENRKQYYHLFIDDFNTNEALDECRNFLCSSQKKPATLFFINAHCFNLSTNNKKYFQALHNCEIVLNDGIGVKLGGLLKGIRFKENMNGTDFIPKLLKIAAEEEKGIFLLGGLEGTAENAAARLKEQSPDFKITDTGNGYFDVDNSDDVINLINKSNAELLIVGMGVPRQEIWLYENLSKFENVKLAVAGGAILDFISGNVKRAPGWMQNFGLEWVYRLINEPRRLFKRYLWGNLNFFINVVRKSF